MPDGSKATAVEGGGIVDVGGTLFHVKPLSLNGEIALFDRHRAEARRAMGPGSFVEAAIPTIDHLRKIERHAEADFMLRAATSMVLTRAGVTDEVAEEFRRTPDGLALEMYHRTRETHPSVTEREFRAVINPVNAPDLFLKVVEAVSGPKEKTPSDSPAG